MGLMSLPTMLKRGYSPKLATGTICATGTLGQIIPPSIALVLLGDTLSNAYQQAQLSAGIFNPQPVSVGDLFVGAIIPGMLLVAAYIIYLLFVARREPDVAKPSAESVDLAATLKSLLPPIALMQLVLGSIISGAALLVMVVIFPLGFILDFIEITFVVVPIVGPVLLAMGVDPVWLGIMIAINLQTRFLTPPFGFALLYRAGWCQRKWPPGPSTAG